MIQQVSFSQFSQSSIWSHIEGRADYSDTLYSTYILLHQSTMVNLNSVGRSFYVLSNILLGIKHKKGNTRYIRGRNLSLKKVISINKSTFNVHLRECVEGTRVEKIFDIYFWCQSPVSATQPSSSACRTVVVSQSPGPVTVRRTAWMPVMKETVRQVILLSKTSQNNSEAFPETLRLFRADFQAICKLKLNYLFITWNAWTRPVFIYFIGSCHEIHLFTLQLSSFISSRQRVNMMMLPRNRSRTVW